MTPLDPRRLQRHLRDGLRRHAAATRAGPFTCYLHPESADPALSVAVPDEPVEGRRVPVLAEAEGGAAAAPAETDEAVGATLVRAHFAAHGRTPRVEYLDECHPTLARTLLESGFTEDARTHLLACTRETWRRVEPPDGTRVEPLLPSTPWEVARRYLEVQREAYELDMDVPVEGPRGFWPALQLGAGILASIEGDAAGAGGITPTEDGLADVRGLAVRDAYRRRGLGVFLLSALARVAHETGVEALVVVPDDETAQRVAERAGFVPVATLRSFTAADAAGP